MHFYFFEKMASGALYCQLTDSQVMHLEGDFRVREWRLSPLHIQGILGSQVVNADRRERAATDT